MLETLQKTKRQIEQLLKESPTVLINCFVTFTLRRSSPAEKELSFCFRGQIISDSMKDLDEIVIFNDSNALGFMFGFDFETRQFVASYKDMVGTIHDGRSDYSKDLKEIHQIFKNWNEYDNTNIQEIKFWFNHDENSIPARPPDLILQDPFDRLREQLNKLFNDKFSVLLHTDDRSEDSVLYITLRNGHQIDKGTLENILKNHLVWEDLYQYNISDIHVRSENLGKIIYSLDSVDYLYND